MIGGSEILIVALVGVALFGASAIPKLARSLGQAKREFSKGFKDGTNEEQPVQAEVDHRKSVQPNRESE